MSVFESLGSLSGPESWQRLFCSSLHYRPAQQPLPRRGWTGVAARALVEDPVCIATAGQDGGFHVIYARLAPAQRSPEGERAVALRLLPDHPQALFIFAPATGDRTHLLNVQPAADGAPRRCRRLSLGPDGPSPVAAGLLARLDAAGLGQRHDAAFDVEALARDFLAECAALFHELAAARREGDDDPDRARQAAFETLQAGLLWCFRPPPGPPPPELAPVVDRLGRYPFTLIENGPFDQTVAITPEMLGTLVERLAPSPVRAERAGVFYTPRAEIDLMCRLALVDHLAHHLGPAHKPLLYDALFAIEPDERERADRALAGADLWPALEARLRQITVLDPACGAGSFLVGMLYLLDDLLARAAAWLGRGESPLARREALVGRNLYGVEVMAAACRVARLRLRLAQVAGAGPGEGLAPGDDRSAGGVQQADCLLQPVFPGILSGAAGGFDLVIGNPPYVRHEQIADPRRARRRHAKRAVSAAEKRAYKARLARSIYRAWPDFFGDRRARRLDARSDLYLYFYFRGLSFLKPGGALCFLSANAWLDVGYGAVLQEFLLRRARLKFVIDNRGRRSFEAAVNTVIVLASRLDGPAPPDPVTRFVTFEAPFERAFSAQLFREMEAAGGRTANALYRLVPVGREALLPPAQPYRGDRWGGKFLRAPDIYWTVLEKGRGKLVRLGDLAGVRFGVKTGANAFFYLDEARAEAWGIEAEFLRPVLFSLREVRCPDDPLPALRFRLFSCHRPLPELEGANAAAYIRWGEAQGFHRRATCAARPLWYSLAGDWPPAPFIFPAKVGQRMVVLRNRPGVLEDKKLYGLTPRRGPALYWGAVLNSTLCRFFLDLSCRQLTGAQAIADVDVRVVEQLPVPAPEFLPVDDLAAGYLALAGRPVAARVRDEYERPDRRALDAVIFEALGLTAGEREAVYESVVDLVEARLAKAAGR